MHPFCDTDDTKVIDSRLVADVIKSSTAWMSLLSWTIYHYEIAELLMPRV